MQCDLANVGALAGHVGARDQQDRTVLAAGRAIVGHERTLRQDRVQHRMPTFDDRQHRLIADRGAAIAAATSLLGQRDQHVQLRQDGGRGLQSPGAGGHRVAKFQEQFILQLLGFLVGREDLLFVLFQFGGDVALGVLDGLLANVVGRNFGAMGVGDFDVVTKHFVEPDFEAGNAAARRLLRLIGRDPLLAPRCQVAQRVELAVEPRSNKTAFAAHQRTVVFERRFELGANVGAQIEFDFQPRQQRAMPGRDLGFQLRQRGQACGRQSSDRADWRGPS